MKGYILEADLDEKGIKHLFHFTQARNLASILKKGIIPRKHFEENNLLDDIGYNDQVRLDGHSDASCFSIGWPNYKMFYTYRKEYEDFGDPVDWVVLKVSRDILFKKRCAFCSENASKKSMTQIPLEDKRGVRAFDAMFYDSDKRLKLPSYIPTNPQAEVLVFENIETSYINGVIFENKSTYNKYRHLIPTNVHGITNAKIFGPRPDFENWR